QCAKVSRLATGEALDRQGAAVGIERIASPQPGQRGEQTPMRPSAIKPADLRLAVGLPPLDEKRGNHREREVDDGLSPQSAPVVRPLPEAGAELIDANHPVDGVIRREYVAASKHGFWDCFARPGKARQEELRKAGAEEDERRRLRMLEPSTHRLAHEAGRENEDRRQRK